MFADSLTTNCIAVLRCCQIPLSLLPNTAARTRGIEGRGVHTKNTPFLFDLVLYFSAAIWGNILESDFT